VSEWIESVTDGRLLVEQGTGASEEKESTHAVPASHQCS
jgi:hypothetical protein